MQYWGGFRARSLVSAYRPAFCEGDVWIVLAVCSIGDVSGSRCDGGVMCVCVSLTRGLWDNTLRSLTAEMGKLKYITIL